MSVQSNRDSSAEDEERMNDLWRDVRYAVRTLARARGFTIVAVTILGIGLGASVTIFSALNGVLLRPLPYSDPDRLVAAWEVNRTQLEARSGVSAAMFEVLGSQDEVFTGVAAWRAWGYELRACPRICSTCSASPLFWVGRSHRERTQRVPLRWCCSARSCGGGGSARIQRPSAEISS
jgi:hypothetical protein